MTMNEKKLKFKNKHNDDMLEILVTGSNLCAVDALSNGIKELVLSNVNWESVEK